MATRTNSKDGWKFSVAIVTDDLETAPAVALRHGPAIAAATDRRGTRHRCAGGAVGHGKRAAATLVAASPRRVRAAPQRQRPQGVACRTHSRLLALAIVRTAARSARALHSPESQDPAHHAPARPPGRPRVSRPGSRPRPASRLGASQPAPTIGGRPSHLLDRDRTRRESVLHAMARRCERQRARAGAVGGAVPGAPER